MARLKGKPGTVVKVVKSGNRFNAFDANGDKFPLGVKIVGDKYYITTAAGTQELSVATAPAAPSS